MPVKLIPEGVATLSTSPVVPLIKISHANGFSLEISLNSEMSSLKPVLELSVRPLPVDNEKLP
jgi:hypothetical protein